MLIRDNEFRVKFAHSNAVSRDFHQSIIPLSLTYFGQIDEGFGFPVLEAQALGTAVVATSAGSIAEVAGDGALLVDGREPDAFADAIDRVVTDDELRAALLSAGHRNVTRFDWATTGDRLTDLYRDAEADRCA